jgi:ADP-ribose pyrophosphatase
MQTLGSRIVYRNHWMTGPYSPSRWLRRNKYAVGARFWEFPQGTWEQKEGDTIEDLARGELEFLARIYVAYGFLTQPMHVFVATGLT